MIGLTAIGTLVEVIGASAMMELDFEDFSLIDCHVHTWMLRENLDQVTIEKQGKALVEIISEGKLSQMYIFDSHTHAPLYLKARYPGTLYAGGFAPWTGGTALLPDVDWSKYISRLIQLGYDGIGEMGSKPVTRDMHIPLDSAYYEGLWESCEELGFPVLCHVGDVEDFWHERLTPEWAKERDWGYWEGYYTTLEKLYGEIESILFEHPSLKITLCHFLFLSPHLERADEFLGTYPNANLDLSLGVELMYNISRRRDDYREFFIRHDDRILFGTDIGVSTTLPQHLARINLLRTFLETDEEFYTPSSADDLLTRYEEPYIGLDLPRASLEKIYSGNFRRYWGNEPRGVNLEEIITTCEKNGNKVIADAFRKLTKKH